MKRCFLSVLVLLAVNSAANVADAGLFSWLFRSRHCVSHCGAHNRNPGAARSRCSGGQCRKPLSDKATVVGP